MKTLLLLLATLFLVSPGYAMAELKLPPPDVLMGKAGKSRIQLREVILDIEKNLPEIRDPRTFDAYFNMLDGLQALAEAHRLDEIYPGAV